jgi:predicted phage terminase large subunit-like protein
VLSPAEAADHLYRRRMGRKSLIGFTEYTNPRYEAAAVHRTIARHLERVLHGEIDRLMLLTAPRHGKSELASRKFPGFVLGHKPDKEFISASSGADLATDFGRDVRNLINGERYRRLFATRLAEDSQAKNKWRTDAGGGYYAVGVGGDFMGRGADVLMIDDPFASMADAQSAAKRKEVWDWYTGTAYNRLQPGGAIVLINHRMHEDDLSGRIFAQQAAGGDRFEVVELPAIGDDGEALWPERFPISALERIRANTIPRYFSALYQQKPVPDEGIYFKAEWIVPVDKLPPRDSIRVYGGSDYAVTADGGDYTVHAVLGLDPDGNPWLLDIWRKQAASDEWVEAFCDLVLKWKPMGWAEENGQIKSGVGPFLEKEMRKRQAYVAREQFPTRGDKAVRAQSFRGLIAVNSLRVLATAPWRAEFESELLRFPAGVHDDQVDACGLIGQLLATMLAGQKPPNKEKKSNLGDYTPANVSEMGDFDLATM